jgi:hypothetical protein
MGNPVLLGYRWAETFASTCDCGESANTVQGYSADKSRIFLHARERASSACLVEAWNDCELQPESGVPVSGGEYKRYWYNLHLVLVVAERFRITNPSVLERIRDAAFVADEEAGHRVAALAVMPDHTHIGGLVGQADRGRGGQGAE